MALLSTLLLISAAAQTPAAGTVEVPFRIGDSAIIVEASVNGKNVSLMFDSGYAGTVVVDANYDIGKPSGKAGLIDFVRTFEVDKVDLKSLKIGAKSIDPKGKDALSIPGQTRMTIGYNMHCDGILGFNAIVSDVTEINFQKKKFIFHPKSFDITKMTPDNKKTFLLKMLPIGRNAIVLDAEINGKKLYLSLDTGNSGYSTSHKDSLVRVGAWDISKKPKFMKQVGVASGNVDAWTKKFENIKIFGVPVAKCYWDIIDHPGSDADSDGTVGFVFLSNFNIVIDYQRRRVWLENFTGKVDNVEPGDVGIFAAMDDSRKRVRVYDVYPETAAAKAGIKEGDDILAIDGKELPPSIGFKEIRRLLEGPAGTKVKIDFSRDGRLIRTELTREALVNE